MPEITFKPKGFGVSAAGRLVATNGKHVVLIPNLKPDLSNLRNTRGANVVYNSDVPIVSNVQRPENPDPEVKFFNGTLDFNGD